MSPPGGTAGDDAFDVVIRSFGRTWAAELVGNDIRVNTTAPGSVKTPGLAGLAPPGKKQELLDDIASGIPMGRLGRPDEIGAAVVFFASDQSSFKIGAELVVDGGEEQI